MHTVICATCTSPFSIPTNRLQTARYCSRHCYALRHPMHTLSCKTCGKAFSVIASRSAKARYCSFACRDFRQPVPCVLCGKEVIRTRSEMKTRQYVYCSVECERTYIQQFRSGKNHPRYINSLSLPDMTIEQKEMIIGCVLGDGCLLLNSAGNAHLQIAHSVKQRAYLDYKHALLAPFSRPINIHARHDVRYNRTYETHRFHTVCHPWLTQLREMLYPGNVKCLRKDIDSLLTPRGLAFWFMDDGGCHNQSTFSICTVSFAAEDIARIAQFLGRWNLKAWERKRRLYISAHCKYTFLDLIGEFVPQAMRYKLGSADLHPRLL